MTTGRLSLGTAQLGMPYGISHVGRSLDAEQVTGILSAAVDLGIDAFDTAPDYGVAEKRIGSFLREHDLLDEIAICTKLPSLGCDDTKSVGIRVEKSVTSSMRRLGVECIDTYLVHDVNDLKTHGDALIDALVSQRNRGRIVEIGMSVYSPSELGLLEQHRELASVQHPFNLLDRRLLQGDWLQYLRTHGIKLQLRSVLLQGLLAMEPGAIPEQMPEARKAIESLRRIIEPLGISPVEAAVAYALKLNPDRLIFAAHSVAELEGLVDAAMVEVPETLTEQLNAGLGDLPSAVIDPRTWPGLETG